MMQKRGAQKYMIKTAGRFGFTESVRLSYVV